MSKNKYKKLLYRTLILKIIVLNVFTSNTIRCQDLVSDDSEVLDNRLNIIDHKISDDHFNHYDNANIQFTELAGGSVVGERLLKASESPYLLRTDLEVERQAKLSIEAGVTIHFAPMVGITIRGAISAIGTAENRIKLTTQTNSGYADSTNPDPKELGVRLVDGPTPLEGRLQIYHHGKWRSVCSNSRNWTIADYETTCRQMGFQGGRFWNWMDKNSYIEPRLLFEEPSCRGNEFSLFECQWQLRQIGSGSCDYHSDIGIQCLPLLEKPTSHWRGLSFHNAESVDKLTQADTLYQSVSMSQLKYVDIIRAGSGRGRLVGGAIEAIGVPPVLEQVTIDQSAYTGINVTRQYSGFTFHQVTVYRSRGFGIFINSSYGLAKLDDCTISENGADGVRYTGHDLRSDERTDRYKIYDFCTLATTSWQIYPLLLSIEQTQFTAASKECERTFSTRAGYVLTLDFVYFVVARNESARMEVYDGTSRNDRLIISWDLRNSTRPQSVSSTREKMYIHFEAEPRSQVLAHLRLTTGLFKSYDLNVTQSTVADNGGRGVAIDNVRSSIHIHNSSLLNNAYAAGLHVTSGAGDVNVTDSRISFNRGDGINITYSGGNRNVSRSSLSSNSGYGFAVWINQTEKDREEFKAFNQTTTIEYSEIVKNLETGVRHGNFCGDHWVNITANIFNESLADGIDIQSCWFGEQSDKHLRLQIGHNNFVYNRKIGIVISPALNMDGKIEYNNFVNGIYGSILVRNEQLEEFRMLPSKLYVQHNQFNRNTGLYVASLGISAYSDRTNQYILFTRNFVRNNKITEAFGPVDGEGRSGEGRLSPRSRIAAPVVISSRNVDVFRNIISNPDSRYEVGSQLSDQSVILNVTYNWLGHSDEEKIFNRIFHRKDRYDLAKIEYLPFLLHNSNPGTSTIIQHPTFVPRFYTEGNDKVGGEVDGQETLPPGSYIVEKDINVRPGGKLILQPGVTLNFAPSVGIMVAGKLEARGRSPDDILFTLKREPMMNQENFGTERIIMDPEIEMDVETEAIFDIRREESGIPIRLLGGTNDHEGRLQVNIDGRWGTVCNYGWNIINAALVCHQLGLALNPIDWKMEAADVPNAGSSEDIILSNVRCTEHDTDITKCRAEHSTMGEFENSCTHDSDVGVRCYEGAWAGLRFGVLAERADLQYVTVEKAGLFDYMTYTFKPAIQMDYARHNLDNVRVVNNLHDGLGVIYSDVFGGTAINNVRNSEFSSNHGNGISLTQLGLRVQGSIIRDNHGSGVHHDSVLSAIEQREIVGGFHMAADFNELESDYSPIYLPHSDQNIDVSQWQVKHIITTKVFDDEPIERTINIRCQPGYVLGIQLLNPIENRSTEEIWIYDSQTLNTKSAVWQLKRDLSVFPVTSSSYGIILHYNSGRQALGGVVIILSALQAPIQNIYNRIVSGPVPTLQITSTKIQKNRRGLSATYYNRYLGEKSELYLRKANESIKLVNCEISHNIDEAVLVHSPFWDVHVSNISEITLQINNSLIVDNGRGIRQFSRDLRSSNNLFHYVLQDSTIERNSFGGFELSLPYVWQYNENFTHSVYFGNSTWSQNRNFGIIIDGHYAAVNITGNVFKENQCQSGLIGFKGMEKKLQIDNNKVTNNNGRYMIEFRSDSQSEIMGEVHALLTENEIKNNLYEIRSTMRAGLRSFIRGSRENLKEPTCVIGFGGIQKVNIYRNLIANNMQDYDLVAGIKSARLNNFLSITANWWGSTDESQIKSRIFDFDDWNNHAEAIFMPYLLEDNYDGSISISRRHNKSASLENLGGKIYEDIAVPRTTMPYVIKSDITIMPGSTMTIYAGVEMEFAPNVGILVLGTLIARGSRDAYIVMRPIEKASQEVNRIERSIENMAIQDTIRLCTNRNCVANNDTTEIENINQGFLEYFNHTTLQWVPICDRRFTERNAQVVCRELGMDPLHAFYSHDRRLEFHTNSLTRIWSWVEPLECHGDETHMANCPERLNGQLYGRRHECKWFDDFVFVNCNGDGEQKNYWGGVRFANSDFEQNFYEHRIHDHITHNSVTQQNSVLEFVRIEKAGILHGEKSAAVQSINKNPQMSFVTIRDSAYHGVNLITPSQSILLQFLSIRNTLGHGVNAISLAGEGGDGDSSFIPLRNLDLPYNLFSLLDICDTMKEITIQERILVYYKYDNNPVNCVKIFKSAYHSKPLGFRLLQANLFNHSREYGRRDSIHLFDGDIYNISSVHIGSIETDSDNERKLFKTRESTLSVRLIASGAPATHGFIAEIVTLPVSLIGLMYRDVLHNISNSEIAESSLGAISYMTAGEVSPILTLEKNRFLRNCHQLFGNFSTCEAAVNIDVQNMQSIYFRNNLLQENQGGLALRADSRGSATSLRGWIHHNLFVKNRNRPALDVVGRQSSPYQEVIIFKNYITQNDAAFADVVSLRQVVSNFSYNYVHSNKGGRIMEISGFDKVRLPIYQTTTHNGFYDNVATDWRGRSTVVAGTAGQQYVDNIFSNPDNDYEMITVNRSIFDFQYWNSTLDIWKTKIDATYNYWSYNTSLAVGSRIRDRSDDPDLLEVQFLPLHMNNRTVLDGKCPPGWTLIYDTCYLYVGAAMTFHEARSFCRSDNASLPYVQGDKTNLWIYLQQEMKHMRFPEKVWIQDLDYIDKCTSFIYRNIEIEDCNEKSTFLCEIDPKVVITPLAFQADALAIGVVTAILLAVLLLILFCVCWCKKSKHRQLQRFERRNSIRQSLRSLNTIDPQGSIRRRNFNTQRSTDTLKSTVTDYKNMMMIGTNSQSDDSIEKSVLSSETSYDIYDPRNNKQFDDNYNEAINPRVHGYTAPIQTQKPVVDHVQPNKVYGLPEYDQQAFELSFRNEGFRDNSNYGGLGNSMGTILTTGEETPIIHHTDIDDANSDYYGNASTLPIRSRGENLSFLNELKQRLPEYEPLPNQSPGHSTFLKPTGTTNISQVSKASTVPYEQKIDRINFSGQSSKKTPTPHYHTPELRHHDKDAPTALPPPVPEVRRPDSYIKAVKKTNTRDYVIPSTLFNDRPRTVYEASGDSEFPSSPTEFLSPTKQYSRSKSEALLETNFDEEAGTNGPLTADSRSYSQPLETAM